MVDQIFLLPLVIFGLLQLADVITTVRALRRGAREQNRFIFAMIDLLGHGWILVKLAIAVFAAMLIVNSGAVWPLWALNAVYLWVVIHNWRAVQ